MRIIKKSKRKHPKISFILLDWSVRESFHILHYLAQQDCDRDCFEVIIVEYYGRLSKEVKKYESQVDTWLILDMPEECYYHKHLMYNVGIVFSNADIISVCDSDAMVKPSHVNRIIEHFDRQPDSVLHIDQFRNNRQDLYPFSFPDFEEVTGKGCINFDNGLTKGLTDKTDPIHARNYGACMCARKEDLISIGGADEHVDFVGHICGPYDLTFRLINNGKKEYWSEDEFTYHTWHPGQAGEDNYLGPHDGRHMSTTSLLALQCHRILPLVENRALKKLRLSKECSEQQLVDSLISKNQMRYWTHAFLDQSETVKPAADRPYLVEIYRSAQIYNKGGVFCLVWPHEDANRSLNDTHLKGFSSIKMLKKHIDEQLSGAIKNKLMLFSMIVRFMQICRLGINAIKKPHLLFKMSHMRKKIQRNLSEKRINSGRLSDLFVHILMQHERKRINSNDILVILKDKAYLFSIRIFQLSGLLSKMEIYSVADLEEAKLVSDTLKQTSGSILISSETYLRFYSTFYQLGHENLVIV